MENSTKWVSFNSSDFKKKVKQKDGETVKESKLERAREDVLFQGNIKENYIFHTHFACTHFLYFYWREVEMETKEKYRKRFNCIFIFFTPILPLYVFLICN